MEGGKSWSMRDDTAGDDHGEHYCHADADTQTTCVASSIVRVDAHAVANSTAIIRIWSC